ncbi:MAG: hypothetical protein AB7K24_10365 [Gemmataceae bacterium]
MKSAALALVLGLALVAPVWGMEPGNEVMARFSDGSVIQRAVIADDLVLVTRFGKLTIPFKEIRRIDMGRRTSPERAARIKAALARLGSTDFNEREAASRELVELGADAYAAMQEATLSKDLETAKRARQVLEEIRTQVSPQELNRKSEDVVHTRDSAITGHIESDVLKARTDKFGALNFRIADLRTVYSLAGVGQKTLKIEPDKLSADGWIDTGVTVHAKLKLRVDVVLTEAANPMSEQNVGIAVRVDDKIIGKDILGYDGEADTEGKLRIKLPTGVEQGYVYRIKIVQAPELPVRLEVIDRAPYIPSSYVPPTLGPIPAPAPERLLAPPDPAPPVAR